MTNLGDLDRHRYMSLATFRRTGSKVATPVWFAAADGKSHTTVTRSPRTAADGKLYVFTAGESGKVKRLRHSSRARIAPSDARGRVHGEWRDVSARIVTEPPTIERAHAALRSKYGWQMLLADLLAGLTGRTNRRAWIEIQR